MRRVYFTRAIVTAALLLGAGACCGGAFAQTNYAQPPADDDATPIQSAGVRPELLRDVSLDQKLGDSIPLDLTFRDEHGQPVALRRPWRRVFILRRHTIGGCWRRPGLVCGRLS